jgi:hypothetical protein
MRAVCAADSRKASLVKSSATHPATVPFYDRIAASRKTCWMLFVRFLRDLANEPIYQARIQYQLRERWLDRLLSAKPRELQDSAACRVFGNGITEKRLGENIEKSSARTLLGS